MTTTDPRTRCVAAQLDQAADVLPGLLRTLTGLAEHGRQMAADLGVPAEAWAAMSIEDREMLQVRHADEISAQAALHAGIAMRAWRALSFDEKWDLIDKWRAEARDA